MIHLPHEVASQRFAEAMANVLKPPLIMTFSGEIGSGKTTMIRAMLRALGVSGAIKSPTFSLVESYDVKDFVIHHFDWYRICDEMELEAIGFRDYLTEDSVCLIEWPERAPHYLTHVDVMLHLVLHGAGRLLDLKSTDPHWALSFQKWVEPS